MRVPPPPPLLRSTSLLAEDPLLDEVDSLSDAAAGADAARPRVPREALPRPPLGGDSRSGSRLPPRLARSSFAARSVLPCARCTARSTSDASKPLSSENPRARSSRSTSALLLVAPSPRVAWLPPGPPDQPPPLEPPIQSDVPLAAHASALLLLLAVGHISAPFPLDHGALTPSMAPPPPLARNPPASLPQLPRPSTCGCPGQLPPKLGAAAPNPGDGHPVLLLLLLLAAPTPTPAAAPPTLPPQPAGPKADGPGERKPPGPGLAGRSAAQAFPPPAAGNEAEPPRKPGPKSREPSCGDCIA